MKVYPSRTGVGKTTLVTLHAEQKLTLLIEFPPTVLNIIVMLSLVTKSHVFGLLVGLLFELLSGLLVGLLFELLSGLLVGLLFELLSGLLVGLLFELLSGLLVGLLVISLVGISGIIVGSPVGSLGFSTCFSQTPVASQ